MTCTKSDDPGFESNDYEFIWIWNGMRIYNDRNEKDIAWLNCYEWSGLDSGTNGYPR